MSKTSTIPHTSDYQRRQGSPKKQQRRSWLAVVIPLLFVAMLVGLAGLDQPTNAVGAAATGFTLSSTTGDAITFDPAAETPTLLYFSMGVGCDGCFAQIPEIARGLDERGITFLSVMVDPASVVLNEAHRFGIESPILIDADRVVSAEYGMLGVYGHSDRPSHSFALIEDGDITWSRHYAEMFVPADQLFAELDAA